MIYLIKQPNELVEAYIMLKNTIIAQGEFYCMQRLFWKGISTLCQTINRDYLIGNKHRDIKNV